MKSVTIKGGILLLILLCLLNQSNAQFHAQRSIHLKANSNWFLGDLGIDLNTGTPAVTQTNKFLQILRSYFYEGDFSIRVRGQQFPNMVPVSHPQTGALRFIATRNALLDRNLDPMPDGDFDLNTFFYSTTEKNFVVVPYTHDPDKYYVFSLSEPFGLSYSVVDMSLNNGLGNVVAATKNTKLRATDYPEGNASFIDVVPGNNCDVWLLMTDGSLSDLTYKMYAYNINASGINPTPVVSTFSKENASDMTWDYHCSPARDLIALTMLNTNTAGTFKPRIDVLFFKFNLDNGVITADALPPIDLGETNNRDLHGCFTPDNTAYVLYTNEYANGKATFYKYDLTDNMRKTSFEYPLAYTTFNTNKHSNYYPPIIFFKPYGDKLFFNIPESFLVPDPFEASLKQVFQYPCIKLGAMKPTGNDWQQIAFDPAIDLLRNCRLYTNTDVVYPYLPLDTIASTYFDTVFCREPEIPFEPVTLKARPGFTDYVWYDGTAGNEHTISAPGKYWVYYKGGCGDRVDTFSYRLRAPVVVLPPDTVICEQRFPATIKPDEEGQYLWDDKSTARERNIYNPGTYWVKFQAEGCTQYDTITVGSKYCPCSISVPNAFSPNNDGLNDYFKPVIALGCVPSQYSLRIFNRWGQMIYKSNDEFDEGWDGTYNGNAADPGSYFYELRFKTQARADPYYSKGELVLIR
ncbi:gliding motility-associated C-terminal domain-containing protein [Taibaiella chishuiensis]|uniref:Gliding motility-associated-like protein n=1 Tax=Taibaiella chishuiensis TaxID=1434707 RepID=A0A2P8CNQ6_9BACT|nr:gliding motility-associated C-terminal domain-containing protein [Taibaiella chishuiensis]PSK86570.1 gliding motility-associated-like protein [Taibaiella chishuiensis]